MQLSNNPAMRLYVLLSDVRQAVCHHTFRDAWARALACDTDRDLTAALASVWSLVDELETAIVSSSLYQSTDYYQDLLEAWTRGITSARAMRDEGRVDLDRIVSVAELRALRDLARILDESRNKTSIALSQIELVAASVQDAVNALLAASEIPIELRAFLFQRLHEIEKVLKMARIVGPETLTRSLSTATVEIRSHAEANPDWWQRLRTHPAWRHIGEALRLVNQIDSASDKVSQVADKIDKMLPPGIL